MRALPARGLRGLLVALVVLAVLPGFVVVLLASFIEQREQLARARTELESTTRLVAASQEQIVDGVRHALTALAATPTLRLAGVVPFCTEYMSALQGKYPEFSNFGMVDMSGTAVCASAANAAGIYVGDRLWYRRALETGTFAVGDFIVSRARGLPVLPFSLPVFDNDGAPRGVVFASLDLALASARLKAAKLPSSLRVHISDAAGVLLVSNDDDAKGAGQPMPDAVVREAIAAGRSGGFEATDANGKAWLYHVLAIGGIARNGLFVAVSRSRADAMAASVVRLRLQLLALSAATLLGAIVAWIYGNQAVARPAQGLLERMRRIERGDAADLPTTGSRTDEFVALDDALSAMQQRLLQREREHREMVQRLQRQQERLIDAQRLGRIAYWVYDLATQERSWSCGADAVLGFEPPIGPQALDIFLSHVHPKDLAGLRQSYARLQGGANTQLDYRIVRDDGSIGWLHARGECERDADGRIARLFGMVQDITASKNAAETMVLLNSAIAHLNDAVLITNADIDEAAGHGIVFANDAFLQKTGYARDEVIGRNPRFLQGPLTDRAPLDRIRSALARWQPVREELLNYTADGKPFWVEVNILPIADETGWFSHWVSIQRDVTERKRAEMALREQEARLSAAMDAAQLGIFDTDIATGRITWVGHHEALWGYAPGEFDGSYAMFAERIHPDDIVRLTQEVAASRREAGPFLREYRVVWPDGSVHWISVKGHHVKGDDGLPARAFGVAMDITERTLSQQNLARANARIVTLLETMTSGFVTFDRNWRLTYINPRGCRLVGRTAEWLKGRTYFDLYPAPDTPFVRAYRLAMEKGEASKVEALDPESDRWFGAHVYPSEDGISIFFDDITRRKRTEVETQALVLRLEALREMDGALLQARAFEEIGAIGAQRMRTLTGSWGGSVSLIDQAAGLITLLSLDSPAVRPAPNGVRPLAEWYTAHELDLMNRGEVHHVPDVDRVAPLPVGLQAIADAGARAYLRVPMRVESVLIGVVSLSKEIAEPFTDAQIEVSIEIADRIAVAFQQSGLRREIEQHTQQLAQRVAERTAEVEAVNKELEAFSYSVSHDLRAPLQAIEGFSRALAERHAAQIDDRGRHYLDRIRAGTFQMTALIDDLISLARVSRADLRLDRIDLAKMAHGIVERLRLSTPGREVMVDIQTPLPACGDGRLISVLLVNLLDNAWKFSARTKAPRIEIGAAASANGGTEYFVADNGAGFDMRYADKLFGAFQRLHSHHDFPGTGIGLATVERIVLRHGGRVWAESMPGVRTVIRFTLGPGHLSL